MYLVWWWAWTRTVPGYDMVWVNVITGVLKIARKDIEVCHCDMMAYAEKIEFEAKMTEFSNFELSQNLMHIPSRAMTSSRTFLSYFKIPPVKSVTKCFTLMCEPLYFEQKLKRNLMVQILSPLMSFWATWRTLVNYL